MLVATSANSPLSNSLLLLLLLLLFLLLSPLLQFGLHFSCFGLVLLQLVVDNRSLMSLQAVQEAWLGAMRGHAALLVP